MNRQLIPDDGYLDGGEPYTPQELHPEDYQRRLQPFLDAANEAQEQFSLDELETHATKMERFRREDDAHADEDEILRLIEE
ncbi:hypothetical protein LCGC14_0316090 [marine sediment metagenome]|uniref:Uncharacterized protein n=1 Tax=marine sediment metagenome TaxID=412755 RepID=A0A0F9U308_9ZZZZ